MKQKLIVWLLLPIFLITTAISKEKLSYQPVKPEEKQAVQLKLIDLFLARHHYNSALFDDKKSAEVFDKFFDYLDYGRYLFTQKDINNFKSYRQKLDDEAHAGDLSVPFEIYNLYAEKMLTRADWAISRLDQGFSKKSSETIQLDREKVDWAKTNAQLDKRWEKRLRNEWLGLVLNKKEEASARETLQKRYKNIKKRIIQTNSDDVFQSYANAITGVYDPHTSYFSPKTGENFDINMRLSLEGIGAQLTLKDEVITISKLIPGGPAIKSGRLSVGDKILGVGQGDSGPIEDVVGWRLDDAVELIRGKRGTKVRLQIEKSMGDSTKEILLTRDKIKLEESAAQSEIKTVQQNGKTYKVGVIEIPSFYIDFAAANRNEKNYRSVSHDVKKILTDLKKKKVDGILLDLRNNGGGSLYEAVQLTGLFIDKGPVVQVRSSNGDIKIHQDEISGSDYSGPLGIIINNNSASASEILTAAIKDYNRGVIYGEPTYGKGTVQSIIDFTNFLPGINDKVGQLKLTIAMFYRINGSSTQIKGVTPDIYIPNKESFVSHGERDEDHALKWREIKAISHKDDGLVSQYISQLQKEYNQENKNNSLYKNLLAVMNWRKELIEQTVISLDYQNRLQRKKDIQAKQLQFENNYRKLFNYPLITKDELDKDEDEKSEEEKKSDKDYKVDAILEIASHSMADFIALIKH